MNERDGWFLSLWRQGWGRSDAVWGRLPRAKAAAVGTVVGFGLSLLLTSQVPGGAGPGPADEPLDKPLRLSIVSSTQVPQYELIEFEVPVDQVFYNPFDPAEVAFDLEVSTPSDRRVTVPGFYYQPFEWRLVERGGRRTEWYYPTGAPSWRVRFAPEQAGAHQATAVLRTALGRRSSNTVSFDCQPGRGHGPVQVAPGDRRFFAFCDGTPFFPIGQNLAFIGPGQYLDTERAASVFGKLAEHGANFARVWACCEDWALAIEARKSAWGRSWSWNPPLAVAPGNDGYHRTELCVRLDGTNATSLPVAPSHPVALRPSTAYRLTGQVRTDADTALRFEWNRQPLDQPIRSQARGQWATFERTLSTGPDQWWLGELVLRATGRGRVWLRTLSLREARGGPELLWEADLQRPPRGFYNPIDCAMLDRLLEAAHRHGIHLQLCLLTRDHYRWALSDPTSPDYSAAIVAAQKLLRYAVARWGWSSHVFAWEYFNEMDPGAPTQRFHSELGQYLAATDPYRHLRTTSGWGPAPAHWQHPHLDIADLHWYLRPNSKPDWRDEVAAVLDRAKFLRSQAPDKPAVFGEFGLADDKWGRSPYMPQDKEAVHFHNALWASAFSGLSATASFWWWETLDQLDVYRHYRPLAVFLRQVPFVSTQLRPVTFQTDLGSRLLAWQNAEGLWGWIFNPQATWWHRVVEKQSVAAVHNDSFRCDGLRPGTYRLQWWDTHTGQVTTETTVRVSSTDWRVDVPTYTHDLALALVRVGQDLPQMQRR